MRVKVQYFAAVRELVNQREEFLNVNDNTTVGELLNLLVARHGDKFKEHIFDPKTGSPRPYFQFLLDEKSISTLDGFSTVLRGDCVLAIIPPVGGG